MTIRSSEATVFRSEVQQLTSIHTNQTYQIDIWLPPSYTESSNTFPVVYLLDSNLLFGAAANLVLPLIWGDELPELIIIGIGYANLKSYEQLGELRERDFVFETPAFLQFITSELMPHINANYRTDASDHAVMGHSYGGYCVLYTLFSQPTLFRRYCAGSPGFGDQLRAIEQQFANRHTDLAAKLTVVVGSLEEDQVRELEELNSILQHRDYAGLEFSLMVMEGESHGSVIARLITSGLKSIYT